MSRERQLPLPFPAFNNNCQFAFMKLRIHMLFLALLVVGGCAKSDTDPVITEQDVVFNIKKNVPAGISWDYPNLTPDYARIIIDGRRYNVAVTSVGESFVTEPFPLLTGNHTVTLVLLLNSNNTPGYTADDTVVMASPAVGSDFSTYVSRPTAFDFTLKGSHAPPLEVEVLRYNAGMNKKFGITFSIDEIVLREQCFFGDICVNNLQQYSGSLYEEQENGIRVDLPAIFHIEVTRNNEPVPCSPFSNASWLGEGNPLCVQYPDNLNVNGEVFGFKLYILGPDDSGGFSYKYCHTWTVTDDEMISSGTDGIVDFVLGNCVYTQSDISINPEQYNWETAYAYSGNEEDCFLNYGFNRWGWVIGPFFPQDNLNASYDLYAGAGQCNLNSGINMGGVHLQYNQGNIIVTSALVNPHIFSEINIYVGNAMFPSLPNGEPTVAPGHYGNTINFAQTDAVSYYQETIQVPSPQSGFYVIVHAVVGTPQ